MQHSWLMSLKKIKKAQVKNPSLLNQAGMTLIEIMIVLGIIGAVLGILLPNIQKQRRKSQISTTKLAMNNVINSINLFNQDCGRNPKTLDELVTAPSDCKNWGPEPYAAKIPKDAWQHEFVYSSEGGNFELKSLGADGREGGEGYDRDITQDDLN